MGVYTRPSIVTNGLVLNLDAANIKSYPGSGTTWSDLSGNKLNGTLTNNTYNTLGGGNISFNGTNSVVGLGDSDLFSFTSGGGVDLPFSICIWTKVVVDGMLLAKSQYNGSWIREWTLSVNSSGIVSALLFKSDSSAYLLRSSISSITTNTWNYLSITYDGTKNSSGIKIYINGVLQSTSDGSSGIYNGMTNTSVTLEFGRQYNTGGANNYLNGNISNVLIYRNKELTATEVLQNYNALKSRFNLS